MRKTIFYFMLIWLNSTVIFAQELNTNSKKNKLQFAIGSSLTYIWQSELVNGKNKTSYREFTWNSNVAFSYFDRFWIGIQVMPIFTKQTFWLPTEKNNYTLYGGFFQVDFLRYDNWKMYAETSLNYGDYCTCEQYYPYRKEGLYYLGIGVGSQIPMKAVSKHLFLELGFFNYFIVSKVVKRDNYTQYVLGLNYVFGNLE